jgi:hypothetical protein
MAFVLADRVQETSTTTGTGTITLAGAVSGYQSFSAIGDGNSTYYGIVNANGEWENGVGTYTTSGTTLSRSTVLSSSNSGNLVNFSAGTKNVFVNYPAGRAAAYDTATPSTGSFSIPVGTTGERPTGASGMIRMNTSIGTPEWYNPTVSQWLKFTGVQVVSANKANVFSTSSSSFTDITDLSASITPSSSTNKVLVICNIPIVGQDTVSGIGFNLVRGATSIGQGTGGTTTNAIAVVYMKANNLYTGTSFNYLDSPATTSSTTYKVQMLSSGATTAYINRRVSDTYFGSSCTLTLMEITA